MVKCTDCGFLAVRHKETRELCEVERRPDNGAIFVPPEHYEPGLRCSRALRDFGKPDITSQGAVTTTINWRVVYDRADEDFDCPGGFKQHIPGLSPKEHREVMDREAQLRWQAEREESDRKWRIIELVVSFLAIMGSAVVGALIVVLAGKQ